MYKTIQTCLNLQAELSVTNVIQTHIYRYRIALLQILYLCMCVCEIESMCLCKRNQKIQSSEINCRVLSVPKYQAVHTRAQPCDKESPLRELGIGGWQLNIPETFFCPKYTPGTKAKGIRQWSMNLCTSQIIIHKITPYLDYNQWLKRLDTQLIEPTNQKIK